MRGRNREDMDYSPPLKGAPLMTVAEEGVEVQMLKRLFYGLSEANRCKVIILALKLHLGQLLK